VKRETLRLVKRETLRLVSRETIRVVSRDTLRLVSFVRVIMHNLGIYGLSGSLPLFGLLGLLHVC
jgi:hypothetical protein